MVLEGWDKQQKQIGAIFILVVAVALYLNFSGGIGRLASVCDNNEPSTFDAFVSEIDRLDGSVDRDGNFDLRKDSGLQSYPLYRSSSNLGLINVIRQDGSCSAFLEQVSNLPYSRSAESGANIPVCEEDCNPGWVVINNKCVYNDCYSGCGDFILYGSEDDCLEDPRVVSAEFTLLNQKQVLVIPDGFMWCNKANNLVYFAPTVTALNNYYSEFETCTEQSLPAQEEDDGDVVVDQNESEQGDGVVGLDDVGSDPPVSPPVSADGSGTYNAPADGSNSDAMWIIVASFVGLFALYWFFERGPNKGFFKGKSRRRRK